MSLPAQPNIDLFSRNLGRGKACDLCRRRKLRCDGVRPVCARCMEARMRRLERMRQKGASEEQISNVVFPPCFPEGDGTEVDDVLVSQSFSDDVNGRATKQRRLDGASGEGGSQTDLYFAEILSSQLPMDATPVASTSRLDTKGAQLQAHAHLQGQEMLAAFVHTDPLAALPPMEKTRQMIEIFFESYQIYSLFQPQRFFERLAKGPEHEDFPHASAIHIMLATAYAQRPDLDETIDSSIPASHRVGAHYRHTLASQQAFFQSMHHGASSRAFFDSTRAMLLLCQKQYGMGDLVESYMSNSTAMRACIGLNLNREKPNAAMSEQQLIQQTLLPRIADGSLVTMTPRDAVEAEEVRRTMLIAFVCDRASCATTLWPLTLAEEDYTMPMPKTTLAEFLQGSFSDEIASRPSRYIANADFFTKKAIDAEQMLYKGIIILGKCAELISRLPRNATKDYIASMPAFQRLESYTTALQLNASSFANPSGGLSGNSVGALSVYLTTDRPSHLYDCLVICTTCIPYACTLTLHEPFANLSEESEAMCRGASRSLIAILRLCSANAEEELSKLHVIFLFLVGLTGRSLIRQLESLYSKLIANEFTQSGPHSSWDSNNFTDSVSLLQADLEIVLLTLKRVGHKWPVGMKQHDTLLKLLQFNPEHRLRGLFCVE